MLVNKAAWSLSVLIAGVAAVFIVTTVMALQAAREPVRLNQPRPGQLVSNPLTIKGTALGTWYFDGGIEVVVRDSSEEILARETIYTQDEDWSRIERHFAFEGTIEFTPSKTVTGTLTFEKYNDTGGPARDESRSFPIRFKK
jgi:hypothetical protein